MKHHHIAKPTRHAKQDHQDLSPDAIKAVSKSQSRNAESQKSLNLDGAFTVKENIRMVDMFTPGLVHLISSVSPPFSLLSSLPSLSHGFSTSCSACSHFFSLSTANCPLPPPPPPPKRMKKKFSMTLGHQCL